MSNMYENQRAFFMLPNRKVSCLTKLARNANNFEHGFQQKEPL